VAVGFFNRGIHRDSNMMQWPSWASGCRCIHVNSAEMASRRTVVETEERRTKLACTDVETTPDSVWGHTQLRWVVACVNGCPSDF